MRKKNFLLSLFLIVAMILAACGSTETGSESSSQSKSSNNEDVIKIGLLTAYSGAASSYGPGVKNAAELALKEINENGGLLGKEVVLVDADTATDPKTASEQAKSLVENENVDALFSELTSAERNAVVPVIEGKELLYFYNVVYEGGEYLDNMFINGEVPNQQVAPVYPYLMDKYNGSKWYVVGEDYVYARETIKHVKSVVESVGGKVVGEEFVPLGESEYSSLLAKIQAADPDFISLQNNGPAAAAFLKQFHAMGLNKDIKVIATGMDENSVASIGPAAQGLFISGAYFSSLDTPENKEFSEKYYNEFGKDADKPNFITVPTYDAIHLWASAVEAANSLDIEPVREQLTNVSFVGPRGEIKYEAGTQHATLPIYLGEVQKDTSIEVVKEFGSIVPE